MSTLGQVTKGRYHLKCTQLSTQWGKGQNWVKFGPRICWMTTQHTNRSESVPSRFLQECHFALFRVHDAKCTQAMEAILYKKRF